jgi:hypothetical protein
VSESDIPAMLGYLFSAWGVGFGLGYTYYTVKRGIEKLL